MMDIPTGFTPGPWPVIWGDPLRIGGFPANPIAYVYPSNDADYSKGVGRPEREDDANARLIALAPEMAARIAELEAEVAAKDARIAELESGLLDVIATDHHNHYDGPTVRYVQIARAALSTPKGDSTDE